MTTNTDPENWNDSGEPIVSLATGCQIANQIANLLSDCESAEKNGQANHVDPEAEFPSQDPPTSWPGCQVLSRTEVPFPDSEVPFPDSKVPRPLWEDILSV